MKKLFKKNKFVKFNFNNVKSEKKMLDLVRKLPMEYFMALAKAINTVMKEDMIK